MKKVRFEKEIEQENIEKIIKWTNEEGSKFLEQWAGRGFSFPFDEMQFEKINKNMYSIFIEEHFIGIIREISKENNAVHIGNFMLSPDITGRGIGKIVLSKFCKNIFEKTSTEKITLNVFEYNDRAIKVYESIGFKIKENIKGEDGKTLIKMELIK